MNRRGFLKFAAAAVVGLAADPERLIWTPGQKTHILPPPQGWRAANWDGVEFWYRDRRALSVVEFREQYVRPAMKEWWDRAEAKYVASLIDQCIAAGNPDWFFATPRADGTAAVRAVSIEDVLKLG